MPSNSQVIHLSAVPPGTRRLFPADPFRVGLMFAGSPGAGTTDYYFGPAGGSGIVKREPVFVNRGQFFGCDWGPVIQREISVVSTGIATITALSISDTEYNGGLYPVNEGLGCLQTRKTEWNVLGAQWFKIMSANPRRTVWTVDRYVNDCLLDTQPHGGALNFGLRLASATALAFRYRQLGEFVRGEFYLQCGGQFIGTTTETEIVQ